MSHFSHHSADDARADDASQGEVRKIDRDAGKITLKHGEIKPPGMPSMTMVFNVKDKAVLDELKPDDKVRFKAINESGKHTVAVIEVVQ